MKINKPYKPNKPNNDSNNKSNNNKITPIVRLSGNKMGNLCVLRTDDEAIETYTHWMNDESINMWIGNHIGVFNINDEKKWALKRKKRLGTYI